MSKLWCCVSPRIFLAGIILPDGENTSTVNGITDALRNAWAPVFAKISTPSVNMQATLDAWAQRLDTSSMKIPDVEDYAYAAKAAKPSATGPDGLPYSAWEASGDEGARTLQQLALSMCDTARPPPGLNDSIMVFPPKGSAEQDSNGACLRTPECTRPLF